MSVEITIKKIRFALACSVVCIALTALPLLSAQSNKPVSFKDTVPQLIPCPSPTFERRPTLRWHKPSAGFTKYYIQLSVLPAFTSTIVYVSPADTCYTSEIDLPFDTIFWRVKTDVSSWSTVGSFIVKDNRIPLLIPCQNPTVEKKPVLQWRKPQAAIALYTIQICADSLFTQLLVDSSSTDTLFACTKELPFGLIFWRVKADDSEFSRFSSFYLRDERIPWLIAYMPEITQQVRPALRWYDVPGAKNYTLEIDNNNDFSSTLLSMPLSDTTFEPFDDLPAGDIFWRVKSDIIDAWSLVNRFLIVPDSIPLLVTWNGDTAAGVQPVFTWHPVKNATSYRIKLARTNNFNNAKTDTTSDTTYSPDMKLDSGKWFWKVSCSRDLNLYSPIDSFTVNQPISITHNTRPAQRGISLHPVNSAVRIVLGGAYETPVSALIYNAQGRIIASLKPVLNGQGSIFVWDYKDYTGQPVTRGLYIIGVRTKTRLFTAKITVAR